MADGAKVSSGGFLASLKKVQNAISNNPGKPLGIRFVEVTSDTIPTTSLDTIGDEFFAFRMPPNCRLYSLQVIGTDMDSNATPTLVVDVIAETAAGVETVLINDSTVGQSATVSDELDLGLGLVGIDLSGQKIGTRVVTTSATPVAGTYTYRMGIVVGKDQHGVVKF